MRMMETSSSSSDLSVMTESKWARGNAWTKDWAKLSWAK